MLAVDREHEAVKEPPPLRSRAQEQPVHRWRQPHHAQVVAKGRRRSHGLTVDAAAPGGGRRVIARRVDTGAKRRQAEGTFDLGRHGP